MNTESLFRELYSELRKIAAIRMRGERRGHTLQTTALIHEAYLKLSRANGSPWRDRTHFLATAARVMRQVLIDHARRHNRRVRLAGLEGEMGASPAAEYDIADLSETLDALAEGHPRPAEVVQLRFILGLTVEETAEALGVSERTVKGDSQFGLAWLRRRLNQS